MKRATDGKTFTLALAKLSSSDQEWVKSEAAAPKAVVSVAPLLAEAIMRIHKDLSISALFT